MAKIWPDRGKTMENNTDRFVRYHDADTLEIVRLVAEAEGISFELALAEELALWDGVEL